MGYMHVTGPCLVCKQTFSYNPVRVPSHPAKDGKPSDNPNDPKEPICQVCIVLINEARAAIGQPQWPIADDAYEAVDEGEVP